MPRGSTSTTTSEVARRWPGGSHLSGPLGHIGATIGEGPVNRGAGPVLGRGHQVGVDAEGEAGVVVAEEVGEGSDVHAVLQ
jgi:hypothetical protein